MAGEGGIDLREIIRKTGHNIEEIRLRAFENIQSKLRNQIIFTEDLIHHKELIVNLMQWFNYDNPQKVPEVLQLMKTISQHGAAASILQSVGAVEFFSMLRQDLEDKEQLDLIDSILNSLFWVQAEKREHNVDNNVALEGYNVHLDPAILVGQTKVKRTGHQHVRSIEKEDSHSSLPIRISPVLNGDKGTKYSENTNQGFTKNKRDLEQERMVDNSSVLGHPAVSAEWIILTSSDRHILSVTETRLQSHNKDIVSQSCEFFKDVLLQDFPAHIFIQRPSLVKTLLGLLDSYALRDEGVVSVLLSCLNQLTLELYKSSLQERDPDLLQISRINDVYSSSESSVHTEISSLHSRTASLNEDRTPADSTTSTNRGFKSNVDSEAEEFESELLTVALQQSQWSRLDYCLEVISSAVSLSLHSVQSAKLCDDVMLLLNNTLDALSLNKVGVIWNGVNDRKIYDVMTCLRHMSDLIQLCLDTKDRFVSQLDAPTDIETIFCFLANSVCISVRFVNLCVPADKVFEAVPESLLASYKRICTDEVMSQFYPAVRSLLLGVLKTAEECFYEDYMTAATVTTSMKTAKSFIEETQNKELCSSLKLVEWLDTCRSSLPSVGFHRSEVFISTSIKLISCIFKQRDQTAQVLTNAKDTLLRFLAHENEQVKVTAYHSCLEIVTDAMGESHVTNPLSSAYKFALFMIHSDVMYEVAAFGLESANKKVKNYAANILVALLFGRLNMPAQTWQSFINNIIPILPVLQCFAAIDQALERGLVTITDASNTMLASDGGNYILPPLEQLRASLRFMFVKNDRIRARGFSSAIWILTQEESKEGKPARFRHETTENAADVFLVGPALSAKYQQTTAVPAGFSGSSLEHLWDVFVSESLDESLRESAAEQLAILIQDSSLHKQLLDQDADKILATTLHFQMRKIESYSTALNTTSLKIIVSTITMLRYLVQENSTLRHALSVDKKLHLDVFKCRLIFHEVELLHFEASCLIAYLVFDEVMKGKTSVPSLVAKRYSLPLELPTHEITTEHREKPGYLSQSQVKILREEPFASMIRISWNIILSGGPDHVKVAYKSEQLENFSKDLQLTDCEVKLLEDYLPRHLMSKNAEVLKESENAVLITKAVRNLKKEMVAIICQLNAYPCAGRDEFFSRVSTDFIRSLLDENMFKRLLVMLERKPSSLGLLFEFCHLLSIVDTRPSKTTTFGMLKTLMQYGGDKTGVISGYSVLRTQQSEASRNEGETYDMKNEDRSLFKCILSLVSRLSIKLNAGEEWEQLGGRGDFILPVVQSLSRVGSTSYYDLPVLEITLDCLSHITYRGGWSMQFSGSGEELCNFMASLFIQILQSFHVDQSGVSTSFMGKGVITKVTTCLCHVAMETQAFSKDKDWTAGWILQESTPSLEGRLDNTLPWLLPLLTDRKLDIRWSGWALSTALLNGPVGAESVVNEFQIFPGGIWASAVGVILDEHENSLVRSQACKLIVTSLSKLQSTKESTGYDFWEDMIVQDSQSQANISGFPAFLLLLDHFNFFIKIKDILTSKLTLSLSHTMPSAHQNATTSCSSRASEADEAYELMSREMHDGASSVSDPLSLTRSNAKSGSTEDAQGSSTECLLLSTADSLSDASQEHPRIFRFGASKQGGTLAPSTAGPRRSCGSAKLKSSLFQLLGKLTEIDAENVVLSLQSVDLLEVITRSFDSTFFTKYMAYLPRDACTKWHTTQSFLESAELARNIIRMVSLLISNHEGVASKLQGDSQFAIQLMSLFYPNADFTSRSSLVIQAVCTLWNEALRLLVKMCSWDRNEGQATFEAQIARNLRFFAVSYGHVVSIGRPAQSTISLFLLLFISLFSREGKRKCDDRALPGILDTACELLHQQGKWSENGSLLTLGEFLCKIFLDQLNKSMSIGHERRTVLSALSVLFVLSNRSKLFALETGFLESVMEDVKDIHVKLNLVSLQFEKEGAHKKKERALLLEIADIFGLLRNLLHCNADAKAAAVEAGLLLSIHKIWSWCLIERQLKLATLELLCTVSAHCSKGIEAICHGGPSSSQRMAHDENCLFQNVFKLLVRLHKDCMAPTGKIENATKVAFLLVTNLIVVPDARSMIWKNNFLQNFKSCQVGQSANKKQKVASKVLTALWIQFLLVLSFYSDGAQSILKVNDMLAAIIAMASEEQHRERQSCLLILRNLLYFPANKPSLMTNSPLTSCLLKALSTKSIWIRAIVVTCFATLLHNCHKAKVALKKTNLLAKLQLMNEEVISGKMLTINGDSTGYERLKVSLGRTIHTLSQ